MLPVSEREKKNWQTRTFLIDDVAQLTVVLICLLYLLL